MRRAAVELSVDARQFYEVRTQAALFDKNLSRDLDRKLRDALKDVVAAVREEVRKEPTRGLKGSIRNRSTVTRGKDKGLKIHRHLRENLAKGVRVQIKGTNRSGKVGVFVASTGSPGDDGASKMLKRAWDNPKGWRHPVFQRGQSASRLSMYRQAEKEFGGTSGKVAWTTQHGRPYFGSIIRKHETDLSAAVEAALDAAVNAIASGHYEKGTL